MRRKQSATGTFRGTRTKKLLFFRRSLSDSTIQRKISDGTESMANTLKLMGFFEQDNAEF